MVFPEMVKVVDKEKGYLGVSYTQLIPVLLEAIKEQQLMLFADRTSCHEFQANQFRLLLSSCAYVLVQSLRRIALADTKLAKAQVSTIRLKLFKANLSEAFGDFGR